MRNYALNSPAPIATKVPSSAGVQLRREQTRSIVRSAKPVDLGTLKSFIESRSDPATLHEISSTKHAVAALYDMKGCDFIQEHRGDDATIQILRNITTAYHLDALVRRFKSQGHPYPTSNIVLSIMCDMEDEGMFGPCVDRFD